MPFIIKRDSSANCEFKPGLGKIVSLQFWHKEEKGKRVVIDVYRQKLRAELH